MRGQAELQVICMRAPVGVDTLAVSLLRSAWTDTATVSCFVCRVLHLYHVAPVVGLCEKLKVTVGKREKVTQ